MNKARLLKSTATYTVGNNMHKILLIILSLLALSCTGIRDTNTYKLELLYIEQGLKRQSSAVGKYLKEKCCLGGKFVDSALCNTTRDTYVTIKIRTTYHMDMMRYLGRLSDQKPDMPKIKVMEHPICE